MSKGVFTGSCRTRSSPHPAKVQVTICFSFSIAENPAGPLGLRTITFRQEAVTALPGLVEQGLIFV
jgi:hypothetical protein